MDDTIESLKLNRPYHYSYGTLKARFRLLLFYGRQNTESNGDRICRRNAVGAYLLHSTRISSINVSYTI